MQVYLRQLCTVCEFLPDRIIENEDINNLNLWSICKDRNDNFQILVPVIHEHMLSGREWVEINSLTIIMSINSETEFEISLEDELKIRRAMTGQDIPYDVIRYNQILNDLYISHDFVTTPILRTNASIIEDPINENPEWDKIING